MVDRGKIIPDIFKDEFIKRKLQTYPPDHYIFSRQALPGPTRVGITFFSRRFLKVKKKYNFSKNYTIYGFRHTFISQLLRAGKSPNDIMKLTGHRSMTSFSIYSRSLLNTAPTDLSDGFTGKL